ncbi:MAG: PhzF family phenazine biosynthesis protein [Pseudomonadota bacterium]
MALGHNDADPNTPAEAIDLDQVRRYAAFAEGGAGGNPAGVAVLGALPSAETMLRMAAEIGYSETAFLAPMEAEKTDAWRIRYFAPEIEVPFCGHATIAAGAALGELFGSGVYALTLNEGAIDVEAQRDGGGAASAALRSPPTWARRAEPALAGELRPLFGLSVADLAEEWPLSEAGAGARHLFIPLASRERLRALGPGGPLRYPFAPVKALMEKGSITTIAFFWPETERLFHVRNAFAVGGVAEDPATGAAAAAFGALLRELGRLPEDGRIEILQGADMGAPSRIAIEATLEKGASVRVSGAVRPLR